MSEPPGKNLDDLFSSARKADGQDRARLVNDRDRAVSGGDAPKVSAASDRDRLVLSQRRDGRMEYLLDGEAVRVGDPLEVYVNGTNGWLHGTFQWTGRERHAPSLKVALGDPDNAEAFVGTLDAVLPRHARVRRA